MVPEPIQELMSEIEKLCRAHRVRRLELFGSATDGRLGSNSDLDFLVEFSSMTPGDHTNSYFGLLFAFEGLFSPRRIDLVERGGVRNRFVLASIEQSRVPLYAAA